MMNVAPGITISRPNTDFDERHACLVLAPITMQLHVSLTAIAEPQPISPDTCRSSAYGLTDKRSTCPERTPNDPIQVYLSHRMNVRGWEMIMLRTSWCNITIRV